MHNNNNRQSHYPSEGVIEENSNDEDNKSDRSVTEEAALTPLERHISTLQNETEMNTALTNILQFNKSQLNKQRTVTAYQSYVFVKDRREDVKTLNDYFTSQYTVTSLAVEEYNTKISTTKSELKWVRKEQNENMSHKQQLMSDNLGGLACNYFTERFSCSNNFDTLSVCKSTRNDVFTHSRCPSVLNTNTNDEQKLKYLKSKLTQLEQTLLNKKKAYPNKKEQYDKCKKEHKLLLEKYKQKQLILENMEDEVVKLKEIAESKDKEKPQEKKKSFLKKLFH